MKRHVRLLVLLSAALLILIATFLAGHLSRTHSRLEAYRAQLRARGEKLTFQELADEYSTNIEAGDSLRLFTNAVAGIQGFRLYPGTLNIREYVGPGQARAVWMEDHPVWGNDKATSDQDTWAEFAADLNALEPTLALIRESLRNPPTGSGRPKPLSAGRPSGDFVAIRRAAQWLAGAALCELRHQHLKEALDNLEALVALGRMNRNDYRLVGQMIRVAVTGLGLAVTWEALQAGGWTEPQLGRLQKAWEEVELINGLEKSFVAERASGAELWGTMRSQGGGGKLKNLMSGSSRPNSPDAAFEQFISEHVWLPAYRLTSMDDDELFYLQTMQQVLDSVRLVRTGQPWKKARGGLDQTLTWIGQTANSLQRFHYLLTMISMPNFVKATDSTVRAETEKNLTITAIALKRFELRRGALPKRLDELVPEFLSAKPHDSMSGGALCYQIRPNEDFCLYSVGEDGRDDGGDPTPVAHTLGLWDSYDAVWPKAVKPGEKVRQH